MKKEAILIAAVFLLAFWLRMVGILTVPSGLNADEAALGYNAYSLFETGKDEYGAAFPLVFKSFGDYKPGIYFYLTIPFVKIFGLTELAVRLPSIILGSFTTLIVYFLAKELLMRPAIVFMALLAISPWHLHFSRGGWETNLATFFITVGGYLYLKAIRTKSFKIMILAVLSAVISLYSYHSARIVVPVLFAGLAFIYWRKIREAFPVKKILTLGVVGFLLVFPVFLMMFGETGKARFTGVGIFSDIGPLVQVNELRGEHSNQTSLPAKILHNKQTAYLANFFGHYFDHYTADFLFINGDVIERNKVPLMGQTYLIELPFLLAGIYFLIRRADSSSAMVFWWLAVAPLAASMTYQTPHALRALNMVIPLTFLTGFGLCGIIERIKKIIFKKLIVGFLIFLFLLSFAYYAHLYYIHLPARYPLANEYGFSEMINYVKSIDDEALKIIVTDYYDQPYILWLFYLKYPPKSYQPQAKLTLRDKFGFGTVRGFDKYEFRQIDWEKDKNLQGVIIVAAPSEIKTKINPLEIVSEKIIYFPNGEPAFRVIKK